jgi:undecaprenyl-diphosphatase
MDIFHSIILGIVEGTTEFLPISSTGHLILTSSLLHIPSTEFLKSFEIVIQLGAITAALVLYWRKFWNIEMLKKLFVAFLPTAIIGLLLYSFIKTYLLGNSTVVVWTLLLGGIALIAFEWWHQESLTSIEDVEHISYTQALLIGLAQSVAVIPGVSRSAATIIGGMLLGLKRTTVVEFSFLLAIPTMLAATGLDMLKNYNTFSADQTLTLSIGFIVSGLVAAGAIRFLVKYIQNHTFVPFGIYRIAIALLFLLFIL